MTLTVEQLEELEKALLEAEWCLDSAARVPFEDPDYQAEVEELGDRIGFGALMASASVGWRKRAIVEGGEFVCSPCRSTAASALNQVREALALLSTARQAGEVGEGWAVAAWRDAEQARIDAIVAYNARLADERERGEIAPHIRREYETMEAARRAESTARDIMFLALTAMISASPSLSSVKGEENGGSSSVKAAAAPSGANETPEDQG